MPPARPSAGSDHRRDVGREHDSGPRIVAPCRCETRRLGHIREDQLDFGRHPHAIEILLPVAGSYLVIHQRDEPDVERASPPDDHLAMDQPVIDAMTTGPTSARYGSPRRPWSAARRAASSAEAPRWNTKSTSIGRLTPVTTGSSVCARLARIAAKKQEPLGRSTNTTAGPSPIASVSRRSIDSRIAVAVGHRNQHAGHAADLLDGLDHGRGERRRARPRRPVSPSLIVFGQIFPDALLLLHPPDQPFVERRPPHPPRSTGAAASSRSPRRSP